MNGTVKFFHPDRGFGFIRASDGDYFFHASQYNGEEAELQRGLAVSFDATEGKKGPMATRVTPIGDQQ
jgi:CspA family cold shock protein